MPCCFVSNVTVCHKAEKKKMSQPYECMHEVKGYTNLSPRGSAEDHLSQSAQTTFAFLIFRRHFITAVAAVSVISSQSTNNRPKFSPALLDLLL